MVAAPHPHNENERLAALYSYNILDSKDEEDYNQLVELASLICHSDMSLINFIDLTRQWGKAKYGMDDTAAPRKISMCAHTILQNDVLLVEDTLLDERFADNPFTTEGGIRFYAGAPIQSENGHNIGTICVCDSYPRTLDEKQKQALKHLSRQAAILLETRRKNKELQQFAQAERELKEKAEAARKAQEQFLSTMSHEIRTPLNGVIGMVNILQAENPRPDQKEYIETLQFASKNLLCIVNDILDYNKISSGNLSLEQLPFNLHHLMQDIKKSHLPKALEKGIQLCLHIGEGTPEGVKADPTRLTQILHNLIGNAVKFTLQGRVDIFLQPVKNEEEAVTLRFEIKDTGIGFDEANAGLLFEQFSQANGSITRKFGGTGLGLAITKKLVEQMESFITVKSKPGKGSTFSFDIRLQKATLVAAQKKETDYPAPAKLRVLIAEDNAINIMITRKFLQNRNIEVDVAYNGKEAIDKILLSHYDLVLMDVHMPVMDGITTIKRLREEKIFTCPVILLTADAFINANNEVSSWGFNDYLLKPFNAADLYTRISRLTFHQV